MVYFNWLIVLRSMIECLIDCFIDLLLLHGCFILIDGLVLYAFVDLVVVRIIVLLV